MLSQYKLRMYSPTSLFGLCSAKRITPIITTNDQHTADMSELELLPDPPNRFYNASAAYLLSYCMMRTSRKKDTNTVMHCASVFHTLLRILLMKPANQNVMVPTKIHTPVVASQSRKKERRHSSGPA